MKARPNLRALRTAGFELKRRIVLLGLNAQLFALCSLFMSQVYPIT